MEIISIVPLGGPTEQSIHGIARFSIYYYGTILNFFSHKFYGYELCNSIQMFVLLISFIDGKQKIQLSWRTMSRSASYYYILCWIFLFSAMLIKRDLGSKNRTQKRKTEMTLSEERLRWIAIHSIEEKYGDRA